MYVCTYKYVNSPPVHCQGHKGVKGEAGEPGKQGHKVRTLHYLKKV